MKSRESFVCCFCKTIIVEVQMDPIEISARPIGPNSDPNFGGQALYSHYKCLRDRVVADIPLIGGADS
jgi:hypothetical protein